MSQLIEQEIESKSIEVLTESKKYLTIKTPESYSAAASFLKAVKSMQDKVLEAVDPVVKAAHAAHRAASAQKNKYLDPLVQAETSIKQSMRAYSVEQEKIAEDKRKKADAEAKAKEDAQKKKLEEKAKEAEAQGDTSKAEELREKAENVFVPAKEIKSNVPSVPGIKTPKRWKAIVEDFDKIPREQLYATDKQKEAHQSYFNQIAVSTRGTLKIEGIRFEEEKGISA